MTTDRMSSGPHSAPTQLIDVGEVSIATRVLGSGPPVLLLHGYPQSQQVWDPVLPVLAERHTACAWIIPSR